MSHWVWIAIVIETMAVLAWFAAVVTRQLKFAFLFGFNVMLPVACLYLVWGGRFDWRTAAAAASVLIYLADMNVVVLAWDKNTAMSKLDRHLSVVEKLVLPLVMANATGWLYCLPFYFIAQRTGPFGLLDALAIAVYGVGTVIHLFADWQKKRFKARPESKGRVLDRGLWRFSRHPNYFGDLLVYVGWALFAANPWAWISPATNLLQYAFDAIPKNEKWAAERYGQDWSDYAARTNRLIPWTRRRPKTQGMKDN